LFEFTKLHPQGDTRIRTEGRFRRIIEIFREFRRIHRDGDDDGEGTRLDGGARRPGLECTSQFYSKGKRIIRKNMYLKIDKI